MDGPDIALLVSTYERPDNLRRSLSSVAAQRDVDGRFEVVVTDDGSADETAAIVERFSQTARFPVRFTTHRHEAFQLARCRNEGVLATSADYLLFLDGDCVLPPDHVALHLQRRRRGAVMAGDSCYLDKRTSEQVTPQTIVSGQFLSWIPGKERRRLAAKSFRGRIYNLLRHPTRPRLSGGNIGIWRDDYERVNGYDENFVGWGSEDRDLQFRLSRTGTRFIPSMSWTRTHHLWHPPHPTFARNGTGTKNAVYLHRPGKLTRCRNGLQKRSVEDLQVRMLGVQGHEPEVRALVQDRFRDQASRPEVEILFAPSDARFSGTAECNLLVVLAPTSAASQQAEQAHIVVADQPLSPRPDLSLFGLHDFERALEAIV